MTVSAEVKREIVGVVKDVLAHAPATPAKFPFYVSANLDQIQKTRYYKEFNWEQVYLENGNPFRNRIRAGFDTREAGEALVQRLMTCKLVWFRNWINP